MGFGSWFENRVEIKAAERKAFQEEKVKAQAETQRKAIEEAQASGKERAYTGRKLPKPNPKKIDAIKSVLSKIGDKAATVGERIKDGEMFENTAHPQRKPTGRKAIEIKSKSLEEEMDDYNKKMKDTLGL